MKPQMKKSDLQDSNEIWNAVITVMTEYEYPSDSIVGNDTYLLYQYYSELESGGHESLFTWFSETIDMMGILQYSGKITALLEKIGAVEYAAIEKKYMIALWEKYNALENGEIEENAFYSILEKVDGEYYQLDGKLDHFLQNHFVEVHQQLIDIIE
ncbi:DMP19 family protein [Alkalihalobacterium bogoriense]|uniref:DMP19 family protein n=1 Tax=Alkalihalobacterium bogoriense TaxID=246272 RepID=UPI00047C27C5|nr:hypothetical protein [Alkalihalobacterium bogoriense]